MIGVRQNIVGDVLPNGNVVAELGTLYVYLATTTSSQIFQKSTQTVAGTPDNTGWTLLSSGGSPVNVYNGILELGSVALGSTLHNWAPPGYAGQSVITVATSTSGGTAITGLNLGAWQVDGKVISIQQTGANPISYPSENVGSTATNRTLNGYTTAGQFSVITLRYTNRAGGARWMQF